MSSPSSSLYCVSPRLSRKTVPEGSNDFQKALDSILNDEATPSAKQDCEGDRQFDECPDPYEDDFENLADYSEDSELGQIIYSDCVDCSIDNDNNNRIYDKDSKRVCHIRQCQRLERNISSPSLGCDSVCLSEIRILECNGSHLCDKHLCSHESNDLRHLKLPQICQRSFVMGTTCSSNFYDKREWHSVAGSEVGEDRGRKRGKLPGKRPQSLFDGKKFVPKAGEKESPQTCTCAQINSDNNHKTASSDESGRSTPQALNVSETDRSPSPVSDSRKDKNSPGKKTGSIGPGHSKLSRIANSKKFSSSTKPDVSPHRLLVRRSYSPQSRINSVDRMRRNRSSVNNDVYRQRSQSWSDKAGERSNSKKSSSPPTLHVHSPDSPSDGNHTALSSSPKESSKIALTILPPDQTDSVKPHEHGCPLFTEIEKDRLSVYVDYLDDDITPISRRRAVSESHTSRSHLKPCRKPEAGDQGQFGDHPHVHWADEERGSALSTSVFLSSIRPRSYSHGAMGNVPQRPILKKVTGF